MLLLSLLLLVGCQSGPDVDKLKAEAVETYANMVFASYEDSYNTAVTLQEKLEAFVANPSEETMAAAKEAWLASREPYGFRRSQREVPEDAPSARCCPERTPEEPGDAYWRSQEDEQSTH